MSPNLDDIQTFLTTLEPNAETHEFCWFLQHADGRVRQNYGAPLEVLPELIERNLQGYNVFVCVNAIDTPVYVGGKAKRRSFDITRVRAVFGDFDDPTKALPEFRVEPSMVVETSPGKHHVYWVMDDCPLVEFVDAQVTIINEMASSGSDNSIKDLSRVMRVPGFLHMKDPTNPKMVRLLRTGPKTSWYTFTEAYPVGVYTPQSTSPGQYQACEPSGREAAAVFELVKANWVESSPGKYHVYCPWTEKHTQDVHGSSTYFAPSTANNGRGGFVCMHAHCRGQWPSDRPDFFAWALKAIRLAGAV